MKGSGRRKTIGPPKDGRKERDEDLLLFREMLRRDKDRIVSLLQPVSDEFEPNHGNYSLYRIPSGKKGDGHELLNIGNDKNDYDWLKTPPATPLFPSLEMESTGPELVIQREIPVLQPMKYSRFSGISESQKPIQDTKLNTRSAASSRSVTPNTKPIISFSKPSLPSDKPTKPISDATKSKPMTPKKISSPFTGTTPAKNTTRDVSAPKLRPRGVSPLVQSKLPATIPGFSDQTPPNLRTSGVSDRASSASRGRPSNAKVADTKPEAVKVRRQSCSPSVMRGRKPEMKQEAARGKINQGGNGSMLFGSRMVERVVNARKLAGVEEKEANPKYSVSGSEVSGFGRMMSRSSLDMALKHMAIKGVPKNFNHYSNPSEKSGSAVSNISTSTLNSRPRTPKEEDTGNPESLKNFIRYK